MLSIEEAKDIIYKNIPIGDIKSYISYRGLYVFLVFVDRFGEEDQDPFYSVDQQTGAFSEFSLFTDGDITEVTELFLEAQRQQGEVR